MMKKILIIFSVLVLAGIATWFLLQGRGIPLVENVVNSLPFGSGNDTSPTTDNKQPSTDGEGATSDLFNSKSGETTRISDTPVAGAIPLTQNNQTIIRYVDRATGHIYDFNP